MAPLPALCGAGGPGWRRAAKMAEPSGGGGGGGPGPGPGGDGQAGPGGALIRVTVKTPKDKEEIVIADGASVREVGAGAGRGGLGGAVAGVEGRGRLGWGEAEERIEEWGEGFLGRDLSSGPGRNFGRE